MTTRQTPARRRERPGPPRLALALVALLLAGCGRQAPESTQPEEPKPPAAAKPAPREALPALGKELSVTPGVSIRRVRAPAGEGKVTVTDEAMRFQGASLLWALSRFYERGRVFDSAAPLPAGRYDIALQGRADTGFEGYRRKLIAAYGAAFRVTIRPQVREETLHALDVAPTGAASLTPSQGGEVARSRNDGRVEFKGYTMSRLAAYLGETVGEPVIDATDLPGAYDFALDETPTDPQGASEALKKLGLTLRKTTRRMTAIVIEKAGTGAP